MLRYTFAMPARPPISDLANRVVSTAVNGGTATTESFAADATTFTHDFETNDSVTMTLSDVDTSGNASVPSLPLVFVAVDTIPPTQPGGFTITNIEQI